MTHFVFFWAALIAVTSFAEIPVKVRALQTLEQAQIHLFGMNGFVSTDVAQEILEILNEKDSEILVRRIQTVIEAERQKLKRTISKRQLLSNRVIDPSKRTTWADQIRRLDDEVRRMDELEQKFVAAEAAERLRATLIAGVHRVKDLPFGIQHRVRQRLETAPTDRETLLGIIDQAAMDRYSDGFADYKYDSQAKSLKALADAHRGNSTEPMSVLSPTSGADCGSGTRRFAGSIL